MTAVVWQDHDGRCLAWTLSLLPRGAGVFSLHQPTDVFVGSAGRLVRLHGSAPSVRAPIGARRREEPLRRMRETLMSHVVLAVSGEKALEDGVWEAVNGRTILVRAGELFPLSSTGEPTVYHRYNATNGATTR